MCERVYKLLGYEPLTHINDGYEEYESENYTDDEYDDNYNGRYFNIISYMKRRPERKYYIDTDNIIKFRNLKEDEQPGISEDIINLAKDKDNFFYFDHHDKIKIYNKNKDDAKLKLDKKLYKKIKKDVSYAKYIYDTIIEIEDDKYYIYFIDKVYIRRRKRRRGEKRGIRDEIINLLTEDNKRSFFSNTIGMTYYYKKDTYYSYPKFANKKKRREQERLNKKETMKIDDLEYDY